MIVGLGLDVAELSRIAKSWERFGYQFAKKILHPAELENIPSQPVPFLAARFAAKEAAVKALGTGFAEGIGFHDIEVRSLPSGKPELLFHNHARQKKESLGATCVHVSLTHGRETAAAVVILEK